VLTLTPANALVAHALATSVLRKRFAQQLERAVQQATATRDAAAERAAAAVRRSRAARAARQRAARAQQHEERSMWHMLWATVVLGAAAVTLRLGAREAGAAATTADVRCPDRDELQPLRGGGGAAAAGSAETSAFGFHTATAEQTRCRREVVEFLQEHAPEEVQNASTLLLQYDWDAPYLLSTLRERYCPLQGAGDARSIVSASLVA